MTIFPKQAAILNMIHKNMTNVQTEADVFYIFFPNIFIINKILMNLRLIL